MASPCEILFAIDDRAQAERLLHLAWSEATRIEHKFSRYRTDNDIYRINRSEGNPVRVDEETANLLDFAQQCWEISEGKFDITSGVGGIGKEYAVDRTARLIFRELKSGVLINYGGDLYALGPRQDGEPWAVGVDDPEATGLRQIGAVNLSKGGLATSGDARRYLLKDGVRYSHILDPTTGWPVPDAPRAVTVIAETCLEAGMLSTLAMLQGNRAREFLEAQEVTFWCL